MELRGPDVRRVVDAAYDLGQSDGRDAFPIGLLERLRELIPCENVAYFEWDCARRALAAYNQAGQAVPPAIDEMALQLGPRLPWSARRLDPGAAVRVSALANKHVPVWPEFYRQVWRPLGIVDELKLRLRTEPTRLAGFSFLGDHSFSERDRFVLELLADHLARARERAGGVELARRPADLSEREWDVLAWVARGKTNKEIALLLRVQPSTIRKHLEHIFEKLGVHTRTAAVARAFREPNG